MALLFIIRSKNSLMNSLNFDIYILPTYITMSFAVFNFSTACVRGGLITGQVPYGMSGIIFEILQARKA